MKRRDLLLLALAGPLARAQRYRTYARCLPDYLTDLAAAAYARRNDALANIRTPAEMAERQRWARRTYWELIGGEPERTALNVKTTGAFDTDAYRVEKLAYESVPGLHIPANLYIPKSGQQRYPGVLFQMGHSLDGKAAAPYQKCCQGLAKLGYVVLAFDPMGQGERTYYPRPGGTLTRLNSADEEHSRPGRLMLLVGDTATRMHTWDAVRSLDVLASHPMVDPKRLASTGQSGGGTSSMMLAAVDDRLAALAVSSGITENFACTDFNSPGSVDDAEQDFIGSGPLGFDRWDLLYPIAPKPMLLTVSARDFFGTYSPSYLTSGREEFSKLKRMYEIAGHPERLEWMESPVPHALSPNMRVAIYNFFEKTLRGSNRRVEEPPVSPEPEKRLWVGASGNVVRDFGSKTPNELAKAKVGTSRNGSLEPLLKLDRPESASVSHLATADWGDVKVHAIEVPSAPKVWLPAWLYVPSAQSKRPLLLMLEPQGRNGRWREDDLYHRLAKAGFAVCAFDVRGIGDLAPEVSRGNPARSRAQSNEESYTWASMILGKPLLGQRVADILAMVAALRQYAPTQGRELVLAARDKMTVPALLAGTLDKSLRTYLVNGLQSYASLFDTEDYRESFANFLPRALTVGDLPAFTPGKEWTYESFASL